MAHALDAALPPGLDILDVVEARAGSLVDRVTASEWEIRLPTTAPGAVSTAVRAFWKRRRSRWNGRRRPGSRPSMPTSGRATRRRRGYSDPPCAILQVVVRHGTPTVRPDDVLAGLRRVADLAPLQSSLATRLAQGPLDDQAGTVGDPLEPDREAARPGPASAVDSTKPPTPSAEDDADSRLLRRTPPGDGGRQNSCRGERALSPARAPAGRSDGASRMQQEDQPTQPNQPRPSRPRRGQTSPRPEEGRAGLGGTSGSGTDNR